jgi:hypothetical protein
MRLVSVSVHTRCEQARLRSKKSENNDVSMVEVEINEIFGFEKKYKSSKSGFQNLSDTQFL